MTDRKKEKCCICRGDIEPTPLDAPADCQWWQGNSAEPFMDGRCCDECNMQFVVPARLKLAANLT